MFCYKYILSISIHLIENPLKTLDQFERKLRSPIYMEPLKSPIKHITSVIHRDILVCIRHLASEIWGSWYIPRILKYSTGESKYNMPGIKWYCFRYSVQIVNLNKSNCTLEPITSAFNVSLPSCDTHKGISYNMSFQDHIFKPIVLPSTRRISDF